MQQLELFPFVQLSVHEKQQIYKKLVTIIGSFGTPERHQFTTQGGANFTGLSRSKKNA
jgi:hypothetical protein